MPTITVVVFSYNHEKYIAQALASILEQEGDFQLEVNVFDDASHDNTQKIILEYAQKYKGKINCYFNATNIGRQSISYNVIRGFRTLRGKYFAILEGDDYWSDKHKISKQIKFLETHSEFVACAHWCLKIFENSSREPEHFLPLKEFRREIAENRAMIRMDCVTHISSTLYRNIFGSEAPECIADRYCCEATVNMLFGLFGKLYIFPEYMSVYRVHENGSFSTKSIENIWKFHLHGYLRFVLYLWPFHRIDFLEAIAKFTRYVLRAPTESKEVKTLSLKTKMFFWVAFLFSRSMLSCLTIFLRRLRE